MPTKSKSQKEKILARLLSGKKLTQMMALRLYGCHALAARIGNLRKEGYNIHTELIRTGTGKHVAEYSI